ncbi:hypothetical protein L484_020904 [Morus notabilis]|uniref:Uncharacterized protein n=1 Tax=Morus notabilis TaxID=981085 RepID=W9QE35_9ROSA|nr:hypothetical protein L484_020904 [Morus notabilis]
MARDFRSKLFKKFIEPLKVTAEQWKKFVEYRLTPEQQAISQAAFERRKLWDYVHLNSRGGYQKAEAVYPFSLAMTYKNSLMGPTLLLQPPSPPIMLLPLILNTKHGYVKTNYYLEHLSALSHPI